MELINCFNASDVRGKVGEQLNPRIVYRIGRAAAEYLQATKLITGGDVRLSSASYKQALISGITDAGVDVIDLGVTGTEEVYFAVSHLHADGGIQITASHNPIEYNGMKFVRQGSRPIDLKSGLLEIKQRAEEGNFSRPPRRGKVTSQTLITEYVSKLLEFITLANIKPLTAVVNAGNGPAGKIVDAIEQQMLQRGCKVKFIKINHQPDGNFPNGIPNPLLPENQATTSKAVLTHQADLGIAWDGDFDRCFLFDEQGKFIDGYYLVGLLATKFLQTTQQEKIIYDSRLVWNTRELVQQHAGTAIKSKPGHTFIKQLMRDNDCVYGGEISSHHYFRDFNYCDSGMIPWLVVLELMSTAQTPLSRLIQTRRDKFPCSPEISFPVNNEVDTIALVEKYFSRQGKQQPVICKDDVGGIEVEFPNWRFNLRKSNTEPLVRLNVETRGDKAGITQFVNLVSGLVTDNSVILPKQIAAT